MLTIYWERYKKYDSEKAKRDSDNVTIHASIVTETSAFWLTY